MKESVSSPIRGHVWRLRVVLAALQTDPVCSAGGWWEYTGSTELGVEGVDPVTALQRCEHMGRFNS